MIIGEKDVRIVLVRPRNPLNIGAAARAMRNFGFGELFLVAPHEPVLRECKSAVGAESVVREARVVAKLAEALEDRTLVIGTSSLARRKVTEEVLSLDELSASAGQRKNADRVAVVFGSEKTGLSTDNLSRCHWVVRIPTSAQCPSMNLAQAVAVCCYELSRIAAKSQRVAPDKNSRATAGEIERLAIELEKMARGATEAGKAQSTRQAEIRQLLLRWPISSRDVTLALGILRDISWRLR